MGELKWWGVIDSDPEYWFVWTEGPVEPSERVAARLAGRPEMSEVHAVHVLNWCGAVGECENEEKWHVQDLWFDVDDLYDTEGAWIDWKAISQFTGQSLEELRANPVWAFVSAAGYYGEHEFNSGGYEPYWFYESNAALAKFLLERGVPKKVLRQEGLL